MARKSLKFKVTIWASLAKNQDARNNERPIMCIVVKLHVVSQTNCTEF